MISLRYIAWQCIDLDLFATPGLQRLPIADAEVYYQAPVNLPQAAPELLASLLADVPWVEQEITVWGKTQPQPRLMAWYGDEDARYSYSGIVLEPLPWSALLDEIRRSVEQLSGARFNSVLLNYYRNQRDSMGMHSDDEPELGEQPVIASLSLGAERTLVMKHRHDPVQPVQRLKLASGSLLLMRGDTQRNWKHGINKLQRDCGPRVNLTFRKILALNPGS